MFWLDKVPTSLYWDEAAILADARAIINTGSDLHGEDVFKAIYYSYGDFKMPLYIILTAAAASLVGVSEWAVRLPNAVVGMLTIIVSGYLSASLGEFTKNKQDKRLLFIFGMLVMALTPWHFHFSRVGFEAFLGQFFVLLSVAVMFSKLPPKFRWLLAPLLGALGVYSYFSVRFVWPFVFAAAILFKELVGKKRTAVKTVVISIIPAMIFGLVVFALALVPLVNSNSYNDSNTFRYSTKSLLNDDSFVMTSNIYREQAGNTPVDRVFFHRELLRVRELGINFATHLDPNYLFLQGDSNLRHGTGMNGLMLLTMAPFLILGLISLYRHNKGLLGLLATWWIISLAPASVPYEVPHALRSLNALAPMVLITTFGLYQSIAYLQKNAAGKYLIPTTIFIILTEFGIFNYHYFTSYPTESADAWQTGHKQVVEAVEANRVDKASIYLIHTDERLYLWFLAFGSYEKSDYESWQGTLKDNAAFDNIYYHGSPKWDAIQSGSMIITKVSSRELIEALIKESGLTVNSTIEVADKLGTINHVILMLE